MIPVEKLVEVFNGIVGWPYVTPGSNDSRGVDCSGAFVYAYRQFGERIYHGSNRIIREYCNNVRPVDGVSGLRVGMAIFKARDDLSRMKAEYKPGGRYYNPALPDDYYHVGLVTSVNPLKIVNATPPRARVDTSLKGWDNAGMLNAVDYEKTDPEPGPETPGETGPGRALVFACSGSTVNLREEPKKGTPVLARVPLWTTVDTLDAQGGAWRRVRYGEIEGYMMSEFLHPWES